MFKKNRPEFADAYLELPFPDNLTDIGMALPAMPNVATFPKLDTDLTPFNPILIMDEPK